MASERRFEPRTIEETRERPLRSRRQPRQGSLRIGTLLVCLLAAAAGCKQGSEASRAATSAILLAPGAKLDRAVATRLSGVGIGEIFVPIGSADASGTVTPLPWPELPTGQTIVLWIAVQPPTASADDVGEKLAASVRNRQLEAQSFGWTVSGVVVDLARQQPPVADFGAALLEAFRKHGESDAWLGVSVPRDAAGAWSKVGKIADLVVWDAYGQLPGERVDNAAWDLLSVSPRFGPISSWGRPVLARVHTLASLEWSSGGQSTTEITLGAVARDRRLRLQEGFALSGVDRVSYDWRAEDRVKVGSWDLARGERVTFRGPRIGSIEQLLRDLKGKPEFAGLLFDRLALPAESASPSVEALGRILNGSAPSTAGRLVLELTGTKTGRAGTMHLKLNNPSGVSSEISMVGTNFVEIEIEGGSFGEVDAGYFYRYEYLRRGETRPSMAALRRPERIRFYLPLLEQGDTFTSGAIAVKFDGAKGAVKGFAEFLSQDGRPLKSGEVRWEP
jgi:hypothetical protein